MYAKDKDKAKSPPASRPFAPRLAANAAFVRSPPAAPRLTTVTSPPSPSSSPASRRPISVPNGTPRSPPVVRNTTPAKSAIDNNVTPRSSARKSKLSGVYSSPRAAVAEVNPSPQRPTPLNLDTKASTLGESFFHASDAPSQSPPRRPPPSLKHASSFIYANGSNDGSEPVSDRRSEHQPSLSDDYRDTGRSGMSWFDKTTSSPARSTVTAPPSKPNSTVSAPATAHSLASIEHRAPRAPSPTKQDFHLSYRKGASQIIRPEDSRQSFRALSPQYAAGNPTSDSKRRQSSLDTISEPVDGANLGNVTSSKEAVHNTAQVSSPTSPPASDVHATVSSPTLSLKAVGSIEPAAPSRFRGASVSSPSVSGVGVAPLLDEERSGAQTDAQSMAAKARQERKVLDLEISNSSLLAINRSLEREIRKQKGEIRRFRRLSRNPNRSSWLSDATSAKETDDSDAHSDPDQNSGQSDQDSEQSAELDDLTDQDSDSGEEAMSPTALAEHDARHLVRDEARLRLDLSKHKQLLLDSQKMNSSLRRCLGITEQLIKDGGRALEYQVNVADVQLGGRVLSPEEVEMKEEWQPDNAGSYFINQWSMESDRLSEASRRLLLDSDIGTDVDSGVDLGTGARSREAGGPSLGPAEAAGEAVGGSMAGLGLDLGVQHPESTA